MRQEEESVRKGRQERGKRVRTRRCPWRAAGHFSSLVFQRCRAGRSVDSDDKEPGIDFRAGAVETGQTMR